MRAIFLIPFQGKKFDYVFKYSTLNPFASSQFSEIFKLLSLMIMFNCLIDKLGKLKFQIFSTQNFDLDGGKKRCPKACHINDSKDRNNNSSRSCQNVSHKSPQNHLTARRQSFGCSVRTISHRVTSELSPSWKREKRKKKILRLPKLPFGY